MPQRDTLHNVVRRALIRDGWEITEDPFVIAFGERFLFVDLGMAHVPPVLPGQLLGATRESTRIVVEIKEFRGKSVIADLEQAIGQYVLYRLLLNEVAPDREICCL